MFFGLLLGLGDDLGILADRKLRDFVVFLNGLDSWRFLSWVWWAILVVFVVR